MFLFLITGSLFLALYQLKGILLSFSVILVKVQQVLAPVSTRPLVYFCCFLIFTEYIPNHYSPVFAGTYFHFLFLQICEFIGRHYEACKIGKILRKYLTAIAVNQDPQWLLREYIYNINCIYVYIFFKLTRKTKD